MRQFDFHQFFLSLSKEEKDTFAAASHTPLKYFRVHLLYGSRMPRSERIRDLAEAAKAVGRRIDQKELVAWFQEKHLDYLDKRKAEEVTH